MEEADQLLMATLAHLGLKMPDEKVFSFAFENPTRNVYG